jgi:hypothetical protein
MIAKNRLIGFFDILGFSARLEKDELPALHSLFLTILQNAQDKIFSPVSTTPDGTKFQEKNFFYTKILSDSIVLISHPINKKNVNKFILAVVQLLEAFFLAQFPLRGAITVDDILVDEENEILLGKKFPYLVKSEKKWDWSG